MSNQRIKLIGENNIINIDLICAFKEKTLNNNYIIYSKHEKDIDSNSIIYLGKIVNNGYNQYIENITDENEWEVLKNIMKIVSKYSLEGENNV